MKQKIALITGVSRREGIGFETAKKLGQLGYTVIITARDLNKVKILELELKDEGIETAVLILDVTDSNSITKAFNEFSNTFSHLDVLINNAALALFNDPSVNDKNLDDVTAEFDINVTGAWRVSQQFLPLIRKSEHGRIVNISSAMGSITEPGVGMLEFNQGPVFNYSITKLALNGLTIKMAKELKKDHILVNAICPGFTATQPGMAEMGARPVEESVPGIVWAATLPDEGPTGKFFQDKRELAW
jgi:NAD(P)-dependent dehydrogenase (short-subunit alcohol dehydrogenase family)